MPATHEQPWGLHQIPESPKIMIAGLHDCMIARLQTFRHTDYWNTLVPKRYLSFHQGSDNEVIVTPAFADV